MCNAETGQLNGTSIHIDVSSVRRATTAEIEAAEAAFAPHKRRQLGLLNDASDAAVAHVHPTNIVLVVPIGCGWFKFA